MNPSQEKAGQGSRGRPRPSSPDKDGEKAAGDEESSGCEDGCLSELDDAKANDRHIINKASIVLAMHQTRIIKPTSLGCYHGNSPDHSTRTFHTEIVNLSKRRVSAGKSMKDVKDSIEEVANLAATELRRLQRAGIR